MNTFSADGKAATNWDENAPPDHGEQVSLMEPMRISETSRHRAGLADLAVELAAQAAGFRRSLPEGVLKALADLVRAMNCYYSNLIEGHDTHPVDIERAMKEDYSANPEKRNLQLEARAHISVQQWIDGGGFKRQSCHSGWDWSDPHTKGIRCSCDDESAGPGCRLPPRSSAYCQSRCRY